MYQVPDVNKVKCYTFERIDFIALLQKRYWYNNIYSYDQWLDDFNHHDHKFPMHCLTV